MFCSKCGSDNSEGAQFCVKCGNSLLSLSKPGQPSPYAPPAAPVGTGAGVPGAAMTFGKSISTCFSKYADFSGRASRPEYWWFYLFTALLSWFAMIVDDSQVLYGLVVLGTLLPSLAANARRLHDTNRSGWWLLISITIIGIIPLIIWMTSKGDDQPNSYGDPV